jgi:hypothetical protein
MCCVKLEGEGFMGIRAPHKVDPSVAPIPLKPMHPTYRASLRKKLKEVECTPMVHSLT